MKYFLSCDWGTSSLRLRLADIGTGEVLAEESSGEGIAATFDEWQKSGEPEENKAAFYLDKLNKHIEAIKSKTHMPLQGIKLVISGMASSSLGFVDVPYSDVPVALDGSGVKTAVINEGQNHPFDTLVIGGVKTESDVIRGEETQLMGAIAALAKDSVVNVELFIFPGTHSKHLRVTDNLLTGFKTYMTGEVFNLLANHSILKASVDTGGMWSLPDFLKGVRETKTTNLLHAIFQVRTNQLFDVNTKSENYHYLSGLLIGRELIDLAESGEQSICLVAGGVLAVYYLAALKELLPKANIAVLFAERADNTVVQGQLRIAKHLNFFA